MTRKKTTTLRMKGDSRRTARPQKPRSEAMRFIHEAAKDLHHAGLLRAETMREFDASCLTPVEPLSPAAIKALRRRVHVSQPVFAHYLNVSERTVAKWERGETRPDGPALKLLNLVDQKGLEVLV